MKLQNDAALLTVMPNGVYFDQGPPESTRLVIVTLTDEVDGVGFDGRAFEDALYQVKAVALADPRIATAVASANSAVRAAALRIDELLNRQALTVTGYSTMTMQRERRVRYTDPDDADPSVEWFHRGGVYRVVMSPNG